MTVFVDTSAIYASLVVADDEHLEASAALAALRARRESLVTTNYVLLEVSALLEARVGHSATREFHLDYAPLLRTHWVGQSVHERAVAIYAVGGRGNPSLVDVTSFEVMRQLAIDTAFAFDRHFERQGFATIP